MAPKSSHIIFLKGLFLSMAFLTFFFACTESKFNLSRVENTTHLIDSLNNQLTKQQELDSVELNQADSLFRLSLALGYEKGIAESAANKIRIQNQAYHYGDALLFISEFVEILHQIEYPHSQAMVFEEIGLLYLELNDLNQAYNYLIKVLNYYEKNENQKKMSFILSRIGLMFINGDIQKSQEYLKKSLDISHQLNDSIGIARDLNNFGIILRKKNKPDSAEHYFKQANIINEKTGNWNFYATNLLNLGNLEKNNKNHIASIKLLNEALLVFDSLNEKKKYALVLLQLGDVYIGMQDYEKAIPYFIAADSIGEKLDWSITRRNGNWGLYYCNNMLARYDLAIKYLEQQYLFEGKYRQERNFQELIKLELQHKNDQLNRQKILDQEKYKLKMYFILAFLLLFIAYLFQLFRKQKFKVAKELLERKILQNELESKERELTSFVLNMIRMNDKKLKLIAYLKSQKHRLKKENHDVIDYSIRSLEYDQDAQLWDEFELRFNKVNSEFYQKLANRYPDLTLNEKRLCAFLLMNMTTKEVSSITGQSIEAIGKARTRLRKKLGLTNHDESITSILSSLC